jgi:hypothetical protein
MTVLILMVDAGCSQVSFYMSNWVSPEGRIAQTEMPGWKYNW